jgi:hypothetical protein
VPYFVGIAADPHSIPPVGCLMTPQSTPPALKIVACDAAANVAGAAHAIRTSSTAARGSGPQSLDRLPRNGQWARQTPDNVGRRLKTAIKRANKALEKVGIEPICERVSPHSLRRTYISLRAALREDPVYIAEQVGHEDPTLPCGCMRRRSSTGTDSRGYTSMRSIGRLNGQKWAESNRKRPKR